MPDPTNAGHWQPPLPPPSAGTSPSPDLPPFDPELLKGPAFDEDPPAPPPDDDGWWKASGLPDDRPAPLPLTIKRARGRSWPRFLIAGAVAGGGAWLISSYRKPDSSQSSMPTGASSVSVVTPTSRSASTLTTVGIAPTNPPTTAPTAEGQPPAQSSASTAAAATLPATTAAPTTPAPVATPVLTTTPTTDATVVATEPAPPGTSQPPPGGPSASAGDRAVPDGATITVSSADVVTATTATYSTPVVLGDVERAFAFRDGAGIGVIYQRRSSQSVDRDGRPINVDVNDTDIIRVRPDGSSLILYPSQRGRRLRLHDVRVVGDAPQVLYSVESSSGAELLKLANPVNASTTDLGVIGAAPEPGRATGVGLLHLGDDVVIGDEFTSDGIRLFARSIRNGGTAPDLTDIDLDPANCTPTCPRGFSVDADGATLAWIEGSELVVARRDGAVSARRIVLDIGGSDEVDVRLRSGIAVVNRRGQRPIIVDLRPATPTVQELSTGGFAAPW